MPPIPTPPAQRWREFRIQVLPVLVFLVIVATIFVMWRNFVQPSEIIGDVGTIKANAADSQNGTIASIAAD